MIRLAGLAAVVAICFALPAGAGAAVLYDQTSGAPGTTVFVSSHSTTPAGLDAEGTDDFTVPSGALWDLTSVEAVGTTEAGTGNVVVYRDAAGLPGTVALEQHDIAYTPGPVLHLPVSGASLTAGHYWVSVFTTFPAGGSQWFWQTQTPVSGSQALWQNRGVNIGCTSWKPLDQCGASTADFQFRLGGVFVPAGCGPGAAKAAGCGPRRKKCKKRKSHKRAAAGTAKKKPCKHKKKHR